MQNSLNKISDIKIAYIGGGSRGWAWTFMNDLALEEQLEGEIRLYDIDNAASRNNEIIGNSLLVRPETCGKWNYRVYEDLASALTGVDFVVISILPGTFDDMEADVHMPERHGIYQSVGDTAGPGGAIRAMRTLPVFREFAEAIRDHCPDAWVINYTNPMSLCVKTLYHVFPQIKAFGCCHEVFGTQMLLGGILKRSGLIGKEEPDRHDININVLGINHFTWFDSAVYKGIDLFPVYRDYIDRHFETGWTDRDVNPELNKSFYCLHKVKFDLFRRFGLIAAAGDRHLAEFMPGTSYLKDPETVEKWGFGLTSVEWRKKNLQDRLRRSDRLVTGEERLELKPSGEEGILLIKALCGLTRVVSNVNIPNAHLQIDNLPAEAVVETNAVFEKDAVRPLYAGSLPDNILKLIKPHTDNHERILDAALNRDPAPLTDVFMTDPLIDGRLTRDEAQKLVEDMLKASRAFG